MKITINKCSNLKASMVKKSVNAYAPLVSERIVQGEEGRALLFALMSTVQDA